MSVTLETPRLLLRQWCDADVDAWADMSADSRVMEFFPGVYGRARSEETAARMQATLERDGYGMWAVEVKQTGRFAGVIGIQDIPYEMPFTPAREVGWRLAFDAWGHGYATEGAQVSLDYAFEKLGWDEVVAITAVMNARSQRVMQRLGMVRDMAGDFDHPRIEEASPLRRHVLYRVRRKRA